MSNLNEQQFNKVHCFECGKPLPKNTKHIHLSNEDVNMYKAIYNAAEEFHAKDRAARTQPFKLSDTEALRAHLKSSAHNYMHPESVDNTDHEDLLWAHEQDHEDDMNYPENERRKHTTIGGRHKHIE